jgi:multidrug resistance protein
VTAVGPAGGSRSRLAAWYAETQVIAWVCLLIFVNQLGFGSIVPAIPLYARSFGVPLSAIGLTIAVYGLARFLVSLPVGHVSDRWGRRHALAIGGIITVIGNVFCALSPSYLPFLAGRFVAGLGAGFVITTCQIVLADISTPERRGRMMATYSGVFSFAVGMGPLPGGILADQFGLAAPFWAYSVAGGLAALVAWFRVPETKSMRSGVVASHAARVAVPFRQQIRILTARRGFLLISLDGFANSFARTGALFSLIPVLAKERLDLSTDQIGLGLAFISVMAVVLAYPSGSLADRFGRKVVIVPSTTMTGIAFVFFLMAPSYGWFLVACAVWAVASGVGGAAPGAYAADMTPPGMAAAAMSSYRMLSETGYVAGPLLIGFAADLFGTNVALGLVAGFLVSAGAVFALLAPETRPGPARGPGQPPAREDRKRRSPGLT